MAGLLVSVFVMILVDGVTGSEGIAYIVFAGCQAMALVPLIRLRARHLEWKIQYDAAKYEWQRARKRAFPERFRWRSRAARIMVWFPSLLAAFVLFFLPLASHLLYIGGVHLGPYKLTVPWNALILPVPFVQSVMVFTGDDQLGVTPSFRGNRLSSGMTFSVYPENAQLLEHDPTREFKLGRGVLRCWEDDRPVRFRRISCRTSNPDHVPDLGAWFVGEAARVPLFYQILAGTQTALP